MRCATWLVLLLPAHAAAADLVVSNANQLEHAIGSAAAGDVIRLQAGTYSFSGSVWTGNNGPVTITTTALGDARIDFSGVEGLVFNHSDWRMEKIWVNCSSPGSCEAGIGVKPPADRFVMENCRVSNFVQHVKSARTPTAEVEDAAILGCELYNDSAIDGTPIDIVGGKRWRVIGNFVHDFGGDTSNADYGIFLKGATSDGLMERNLVICGHNRPSFGIEVGMSFGGGGTGSQFCPNSDCSCEDNNSIARNNIVMNCSDVGLHTKRACGSKFYNNLVYQAAGLQIQNDGAGAPVDIQNNVIDGSIFGGSNRTESNNLTDATSVFQNAYANIDDVNLRDGSNTSAIRDQGANLAEVTTDYCGAPRSDGHNDLGPVEFPATCNTWPWPSSTGPIPDAGVIDTGSGTIDTGVIDTGVIVADSGVTNPDATTAADATTADAGSTGRTGSVKEEGCSCAATSTERRWTMRYLLLRHE